MRRLNVDRVLARQENESSMMDGEDSSGRVHDITYRIASAVRALRTHKRLSLEDLARESGVSRSMLSLIERGESSPTAIVLEKIATALGVPLASLFEDPSARASPVSRRADRTPWRDPQAGYQRWNISPPGFPSPIQIIDVIFPPHAKVAFETGVREPEVHQQIWVKDGQMEVTLGSVTYSLSKGDCLAMKLDRPITYRNRTDKPANYVVVIAFAGAITE